MCSTLTHHSTRPVLLQSLCLLVTLLAGVAFADDSDELEITQWRVAGIELVDARTAELRLTASLRNLASGSWTGALARPVSLPRYVEAVDDILEFDAIQPFALAASSGELVFELPRALVPVLLRGIRSGSLPFTVSGTDLTRYSRDVAFVDEATDTAYLTGGGLGQNVRLEFTELTALLASLVPGQVLMEDQSSAGYAPAHITPTLLPGEVIEVRVIANTVEVELAPVTLLDLVESGTLSAGVAFAPAIPEGTVGTFTYLDRIDGCEDESHLPDGGGQDIPVECAFAAIPLRFNDVDLGGGVTLDGEILLRSSGIALEVRMRDGQPKKVTASMNFGYVASARLLAEQDVVLDPQEQRLWQMTLPTYTVSLGGFPITITPDLELLIGAQANLHAGATFSLNQSATVGVEIGWNDGEHFAEPITVVEPVAFSPPRLTDDTQANARLWSALDVAVTVNGTAGPFVRTSLFGDLFVSPVADPWWVTGAGVEQDAGFQLSLLGIELESWDAPVLRQRIAADSGARPPLDYLNMIGNMIDGQVSPSSGEDVRWAIALSDGSGSGLYQDADVTALADGGLLLSGHNTTAGFLVKVDAFGTPVWEKELPSRTRPVRVVEADDGGLLVAGDRNGSMWFARHDASGGREWFVSYDVANNCELRDFAVFADELGAPAYLLVGRETDGGVDNRDPCAVRLDAEGNLVWASTYAIAGADWANAVTETGDGNFVLVGETQQDVDSLYSRNGLIMKIDPNGVMLWARAVGSALASAFETVVELGNGTLIAAGGIRGVVNDDYPALWVVNSDQDGHVFNQALLAQDAEWEAFIDDGSDVIAPPWEQTSGGNTAYDIARSAIAVPGGLVLAGSTGLGDEAAIWTIKLNESLGVTWMTTYDGALEDRLHGVALTPNGIVVSGVSDSFVPLGTGGNSALFLASLPQEGLLDFADGAAATSRYVQPLVYSNGLLPEFGGGNPTADVPFVILPAGVVAGEDPPEAPVDAVSTVTRLTD